jgi:hypothetical protein
VKPACRAEQVAVGNNGKRCQQKRNPIGEKTDTPQADVLTVMFNFQMNRAKGNLQV